MQLTDAPFHPSATSASQPAMPASGSPYTNTSGSIQFAVVSGGVIVGLTLVSGGVSLPILTLTSMQIILFPGDTLTVTYTGTPTLTIKQL